MKIPTLIQGIIRKNREDCLFQRDKVIPQNAFCESVCHKVYHNGSQQLDQCLDDCRDN